MLFQSKLLFINIMGNFVKFVLEHFIFLTCYIFLRNHLLDNIFEDGRQL